MPASAHVATALDDYIIAKSLVEPIVLMKDPVCWICGERFDDYGEVELEHKEPKGIGGGRRDDHRDNLALAHKRSNREKGSKRIIAIGQE